MKKKWTPVFVIAGIVLLLFGGAVGIQLVQRYMPSKNQADIGELLGITDDASQAAIYQSGNRLVDADSAVPVYQMGKLVYAQCADDSE